MKKLFLPCNEKQIRDLKCGDLVLISGTIFTARDAAHKYLFDGGEMPFDLRGLGFYHCGPVVIKENGKWKITAAGPTTSMREEEYSAKIIEKFGLRVIIGKGGMGNKTALACEKFGCAYFSAYGGCAQLLADKIIEVKNVYFYDDFGAPEAMWQLEIKDFPAVVTIDSYGENLHAKIEENSQKIANKI